MCLNHIILAQNIFHSRDFWATKPSIETIKEKMAQGNNLVEMGAGGWDGAIMAIQAHCDLETIQFIFDQNGIDVNVPLHHNNNFLMWTAAKGNLEIMKFLLQKGSKTDIINSHGQSLLMHVPMSGKADSTLYEFCLQNGADIKNDKDEQGRNVMLVAITRLKDIHFINYFLRKGLSLNDTDTDGNGLFHYAVMGGNLKIIQELVAMGVSYAPNKLGENAFAFVAKGPGAKLNLEILEYLKALGLNPQNNFANGQNLVHTAAKIGADEKIIQFLQQNNLDFAQTDQDANTPLILTAANANTDFLNIFLAKNNINATNKQGKSALFNAVAYNSPEVVNFLIEKGAKINLKDKDGNDLYFALISAYRKGKNANQRTAQILSLLQKSGLQMPKTGKLLHTALDKDDKDLLNLLLDAGEDINAKDKDGYTVLHYASMRAKNLDLIQFLIQKGANPNIKTELGESITQLIAENEILAQQNLNLDFLK